MQEQIKMRLIKAGKKNRVCRYLVLLPLAMCVFLFRVAAYIRGNGKRFSILAMTFFLFVVYSSFSFPIFISGEHREEGTLDISTADNSIFLAQESDWETDQELVAQEDEEAHGYEGLDRYGVDEILQFREETQTEASAAGKASTGEEDRDPEEESGEEVVFSKDDWRLLLVNKQHSIPEDYTFNLGTITGTLKCDERIIDDLLAMMQAAKEEGINLQISSPFRTEERQTWLLNRKISYYMNRGRSFMEAYQISSRVVTLPGNSEHQIGLALDIVSDTYGLLEQGFEDTEAGKWLAANSYRYGFILRYPKDKEYYTGIEYEPWHFRYVGVEAATVITQRGITLEEFWEEL